MKTRSYFLFLFSLALALNLTIPVHAVPTKLGDLDDDGIFTANDLAKLVAHGAGTVVLAETLMPFADLNQDGVINSTDQQELVKLILGSATPQDLPFAKVQDTSPYEDEGDVAVTREVVVHFTIPLALSAALDTDQFFADSGGRKILSRVEISSDRLKATLFFLEPLPSNSRVRVVLAPTALNDLLGRGVDLDEDGVAGGNMIYFFETLSITALPGTAISGRVLASEPGPGGADVPIAGATISVDGAEETLRTTTDAQGNFVLNPCPAGSFFVHVDGRTSGASNYPNGNYYPSVGKRWDAVPGSTANLSGNVEDPVRGTIYLPLITAGTLKAVSAVNETEVEFPEEVLDEHPELEGTQLFIPPNSLFADDGTRGGLVGIAPVDSDRLPSPLPPGMQLPMVITIQTDGGSNFDQPVPIIFPNLPDPVTGLKLPAGAKTALWSFNHDTGNWEIVGPMTVTEDGEFIKSDAGVGIRQPGWHGAQQGSGGNGGPPRRRRPPPPDDPPCPDKSTWDYANLAYDIGKEVASCALEVGKAKQGLKCMFTLVDLTKNLLVGAANIGDALGRGEKLEALEQFLGVVEADLADTEALLDCVTTADPIAKVHSAFECIGNALNIADSLCQFNDDPSAPEKCRVGRGMRSFCGFIQTARALHSEIKIFVDLVKNLEEQAVLATATFAVKQVKLILESARRRAAAAATANGAPPPPPGEIDLTQAERDQLRAALDVMQKELGKLSTYATNMTKMKRSVDAYQTYADAMLASLNEDLKEAGEAVQRSSFYKISIDDVIRRGRTPNSGGLSLIMAPDARYDLEMYDATARELGTTQGATGPNGSNINLNTVVFFSTAGMTDTDTDGLVDRAEGIVGTNPADADSDNDGLLDGAEVAQGSDPLGGLIVQTGIVAAAAQAGMQYRDVCTSNNLAVTANGVDGISIFNISNALSPTLLATLDTPGQANSVVIAGNFILVADLSTLLVVDASDFANINIRGSVLLQDTTAVTTDGTLAYVGSQQGKLSVVDIFTASVLAEFTVPGGGIQDVTVWRDFLYILQLGKLTPVRLDTLELGTPLTMAGNIGAGQRRLRLFAGDGTLYASHTQGFNIVDTTVPMAPTLVSNYSTAQFGWKQIVTGGANLGIAATSQNSTDDGPHHIDLYTLGSDARTPAFNSTFETPGLAACVSIYNGLAYVADNGTGLLVLSYLPFDSLGVAPTISLTSSIPLDHMALTGEIESGKPCRLFSNVTDDVQVRNVELHIDGALVQIDGNYPFDFGFTAPSRSPAKTSFTLRAKATDTGGNATWSPIYTIAIIPDLIPPLVKRTYPTSIGSTVRSVLAIFNEKLDAATVTPTTILLTFAGPDGILGNVDDVPVTADSVALRDDINATSFNTNDILPAGLYRGRLTTGITDTSGNALANEYTWTFNINNSSVVWVGLVSGNWSDGANWSTGTVPGPGSDVIIDAGPGVGINLAGASLVGVNITVQGGASLFVNGDNTVLNNITLSGDLRVNGNSYITIIGGITFDNGRLIMAADLNQSQGILVQGTSTFTGTGEILLGNGGYVYLYSDSGCTLGSSITTRANGYVQIFGYNLNPTINEGTITVETAESRLSLTNIRNEGTITLALGSATLEWNYDNNGTIDLSGTGELVISSSGQPVDLASLGTINRTGAGGTISISGTLDLAGGTLALNATTGSWQLKGGSIRNGSITTTGGAILVVPTNSYSQLDGVDLQGILNMAQGSQLNLRGAWQNHGTITMTDAILELEETYLMSEIGTINRNGNSIVRLKGVIDNTGLTFDPGGLPAAFQIYGGTIKGGTIGHAAPGPVIMKDYEYWGFDGVTLSRDLQVGYGATLDVKNGLTLNNVNIIGLSADSPLYAHVVIYFYGTQTVGGTGSILFDDPSVPNSTFNAYIYPTYDNQGTPSGTVTFGPGITTRFGQYGNIATQYDGEFIHQGTLFCATAGTKYLHGDIINTGTINISSGTLSIGGSVTYTWSNTGTINLSGTGVFEMGGTFTLAQLGTVNRTGGTQRLTGLLDLTPAGTLALNATTGSWELGTLSNYGTIKGGTVTTAGGTALIVADGSSGKLDGTTLQGTITATDSQLSIIGDWVNQGVINITNSTLQIGGEFTIAELGTINRTGGSMEIIGVLDNTSASFQIDGTGLRLGPGGTIKGGTITSSSPTALPGIGAPHTFDGVTLASSFQFENQLQVKNGLTINAGVTLTSSGSLITAIGTQTIGGGGTLLFAGPPFRTNTLQVDRTQNFSTPAVLTFGPALTLLGQNDTYIYTFYFGDNIINQGLIRSETAGKVIDIRRPFQNNGQIQEANGGTVNIHD